jgi:hypothetical protein
MGDEAQVGIHRLLGGMPDLERLTLELHVFKDFVCTRKASICWALPNTVLDESLARSIFHTVRHASGQAQPVLAQLVVRLGDTNGILNGMMQDVVMGELNHGSLYKP